VNARVPHACVGACTAVPGWHVAVPNRVSHQRWRRDRISQGCAAQLLAACTRVGAAGEQRSKRCSCAILSALLDSTDTTGCTFNLVQRCTQLVALLLMLCLPRPAVGHACASLIVTPSTPKHVVLLSAHSNRKSFLLHGKAVVPQHTSYTSFPLPP
jgi:hypothetical protein